MSLHEILVYLFFLLLLPLFLYIWLSRNKNKKKYDPHGKRGFEIWGLSRSPLGVFFVLGLTLLISLIFRDGYYKGTIISIAIDFSTYYALVALAMPMLRKRFSAKCCADMWMVPGFMINLACFRLNLPLTVICLPFDLKWFVWVWLGGMLLTIGYFTLGHLVFCRKLFKNAFGAQEEVKALWEEVQQNARDPNLVDWKPLQLFISPNTSTPVSVGLRFARSRTVLPDKSYTPEELTLIFRHELIHIYRRDAQTKLLLALWTAFLWFNPLMWLASRRCREDIELCCDEFALFEQQDATRRQYAQLLLSQVGDERGFSTCMSATMSALRYRMSSILKPVVKRSGEMLIVFAFLFLAFSYSMFNVADAPASLETASGFVVDLISPPIQTDMDKDAFLIGQDVQMQAPYTADITVRFRDECLSQQMAQLPADTLWNALRGEKVYCVRGAYEVDDLSDAEAVFVLPAGEEKISVSLYGRYVLIQRGRDKEKLYVFSHKPDWRSLLIQ